MECLSANGITLCIGDISLLTFSPVVSVILADGEQNPAQMNIFLMLIWLVPYMSV